MSKHYILILEDCAGDAILLKKSLAPFINHEVKVVTSVSETIEELNKTQYSVVLSDLDVDDSIGMETLDKLSEWVNKIPIIVTSGNNDTLFTYECLKRGAQDYIYKNNLADLPITFLIDKVIYRFRYNAKLIKNSKCHKCLT